MSRPAPRRRARPPVIISHFGHGDNDSTNGDDEYFTERLVSGVVENSMCSGVALA